MNPTSINSIEPLTGSNFKRWKRDLEIALGLLDHDVALREEKPVLTDESTAEQRLKLERWEKANRICLLIMKKSMTEAIYGGIPDSENAKEYLKAVAEKFKESDKAETGNLMNRLATMKYDGTEDMRVYLLGMVIYNAQKDKWDLNELITICVQEEARIKKEKEVNTVHLTTNAAKRHFSKPSSHASANKENSKANPPPKRGGEYYGKYDEQGRHPSPLARYLQDCGIVAQYTNPRTPQENGVSERRNRTLKDMGIDYTETFSPVSTKDAFRIIMALVTHFDMFLHQMDVKTAFLNGELSEEIVMQQPEGFVEEDSKQLVCKLKKSIYGLKQASRQWYLKFHKIITSFGFVENRLDECIYLKNSGSRFIFLVLYVDDILLASSDESLLYETKNFLSMNFEMKDLGEASYVLGIEIHRDRARGLLGLSQKAYIEKV
ncbi:unnamed protein product [Prunus brigantina]